MKDSEIYRRAAYLLETDPDGQGCCNAIGDANPLEASRLQGDMREMFLLDRPDANQVFWMRDRNEPWPINIQDRRILALCFMAAIAESEGR